jgi:thiazole/oxazole-forming peptide maturase SagD family component
LRFRAFDLTVDHAVPAFLVLALADARPALAIGTAADLIPARALRRAVGEAMTSWRSAAAICRRDAASSQEILRRMTRRSSLVDHSLYYAQPESLRHFEFLLHSGLPPRSIPSFGVWDDLPSSMEDRIEQVVGRLRQAGHDVVLFDVTQPDVSVLGLHVVRAVSTTLVRPTIGLRARHLGNQRIRSVPWQLGYVAYPPSIDDLLAAQNPAP